MPRRGLNDSIHGDRAAIRGARPQARATDDWDLFHKSFGSGSVSRLASELDDWRDSPSVNRTGAKPLPRCYETHPPLVLPGTELVIYGGSCISPVVVDADDYVGFERGMHRTARSMPWNPGNEVQFAVPDMGVPSDVGEYRRLVDWVASELIEGRKVHCGCIGGHGRTGMFFAALVSQFGEQDATTYVRENYCQKAVESEAQVAFLEKHFGVRRVRPAKTHAPVKTTITHTTAGTSGGHGAKATVPAVVNNLYEPRVDGSGIWG